MNSEEVKEYIKTLSLDYRSHLTSLYQDTDMKVREIISQEHLPVTTGQFRTLMVPIKCEDICKFCNCNMVFTPVRDPYSSRRSYCPNCGHKKDGYCKCERCENERHQLILAEQIRKEELARQKLEGIRKSWGGQSECITISDLTFKQKVMVGTLMHWSNSEDIRVIKPSSSVRGSIVPWNNVDGGFIEELLDYHILRVDVESNPKAFNEDGTQIIDINKVRFLLNLECENSDLADLLLGNYEGTDEEKIMVWKELYILEAIEYLLFRLDLSGYTFNPGEKTMLLFADLSNDFSLSQCFQMIYSGYRNAMTKICENQYSHKHAINSIIWSVENYAANVRNGLWSCHGYSRDKRIPRSALSSYVYNRVLKMGDMAYELPVTVESLKDYYERI